MLLLLTRDHLEWPARTVVIRRVVRNPALCHHGLRRGNWPSLPPSSRILPRTWFFLAAHTTRREQTRVVSGAASCARIVSVRQRFTRGLGVSASCTTDDATATARRGAAGGRKPVLGRREDVYQQPVDAVRSGLRILYYSLCCCSNPRVCARVSRSSNGQNMTIIVYRMRGDRAHLPLRSKSFVRS